MNQDVLNKNLIKTANEVLKFLETATPGDIQREFDSYSERVKLIVEEGRNTWDIEAVEIEYLSGDVKHDIEHFLAHIWLCRYHLRRTWSYN